MFVGLARIMTLGAIYDATYIDAGQAVAYETAEWKEPAVALGMITPADLPRSMRECSRPNRSDYPCHHSRGRRVGEPTARAAVTYGGHVVDDDPTDGAPGGPIRRAADHTCGAPSSLSAQVA